MRFVHTMESPIPGFPVFPLRQTCPLMLRNDLVTAFRSLRRRPGYTALNLIGLAVGMACCLLIGLYVQNELSYDRFHPDADRIVRIVQATDDGGQSQFGDGVVPILQTEIPGVETVVQVHKASAPEVIARAATTGPSSRAVSRFEEENLFFADTTFFDVFAGFELQRGDPATALRTPGSVVLTPETARRYFGDEDPMGQTLIREDVNNQSLTVTGIMKPIPATSHLQFDLLTNFGTFFTGLGYPATAMSRSFFYPLAWTYARLQPSVDRAEVEQQIIAAVGEQRSPEMAARYTPALQPLTRIHLFSSLDGEPTGQGSILQVYVFGAIAVFVLLIAAVNFVNLATARATERSMEIGVRKSVGASQPQLIRQFLGESVLLSTGAAGLALLLTQALLPAFTSILGKTFAVDLWSNGGLWLGVLGVVVLTGLGAGSYPALILARFQPARVLKDVRPGGSSREAWLRKGLVVLQFAISVALIAATAAAYSQLEYLRTAQLGFEQEQVVTMDAQDNYRRLKEQLLNRPEVISVSAATTAPGVGSVGSGGVRFEVNGQPPSDDQERLKINEVDAGFFETMGIELLTGREFSLERRRDIGQVEPAGEGRLNPYYRNQALVVNRSVLDRFGWTPEEALGQRLRLFVIERETIYVDFEGEVVGVAQNYHTASLREAIPPVVYVPALRPSLDGGPARYTSVGTVLAKVAPGNAATVMDALQDSWEAALPTYPFDAAFLDDKIQAQYQNEQRLGQIVGVFSGLAVLVACLGLFGLATYATRQRTKEIGIRKAVGATVFSIVGLLSKDFLKLVAFAIVVGAPIAYYAVEQWLTGFAYRVNLGVLPFLGAAGVALVVAGATVSYHALRAARTNPSHVLRSE